MAPTKAQFLDAHWHLQRASDSALLVHWTADEYHMRGCVENMQTAATALGFELVQRVTPAARDGGRMDCEVSDA